MEILFPSRSLNIYVTGKNSSSKNGIYFCCPHLVVCKINWIRCSPTANDMRDWKMKLHNTAHGSSSKQTLQKLIYKWFYTTDIYEYLYRLGQKSLNTAFLLSHVECQLNFAPFCLQIKRVVTHNRIKNLNCPVS